MTPATRLLAHAARRYVGGAGRTIVSELAGEAAQRYRTRTGAGSPPPPAPSGPLAAGIYRAWLAGLVAFALVILNVDLFLPAGRFVDVFRLTVGGILLLEGIALLVVRLGVRDVLVARYVARSPRRTAWRRRVAHLVLTLLGLAWLGAGVLQLLRGLLGAL